MTSNLIVTWYHRISSEQKSVATLIPLLYLKGMSMVDMLPVLKSLPGKDAKGLSANSICRLKER